MSTQATVLPATPADGDGVNVRVELPFLEPMVLSNTLAHFAMRAVPALERVVGGAYARVVSAPAGPAVATVSLAGDTLMCDLNLSQPRDREHVIGQVRRRFDLMRAMSHPDILLTTDLGVVKSAQAHGVRLDGGRLDLAPWRSYVTNHLWAAHR